MMKIKSIPTYFLLLMALPFLVQCEGTQKRNPQYTAMTKQERQDAKHPDKFLGEPLFTTNRKKKKEPEYGIGVNAYLWRASLDTFSFMPFEKVEPFSGVITTQWHSPPGAPQERLKANILILDRQLRADGVRVSLFHQIHDKKKGWIDITVDPATNEELEKTILTRARQLKVDSAIQ